MENKSTIEELLHRQLELLAERSKESATDELLQLTHAMVEVHEELKPYKKGASYNTGNYDRDEVSVPSQRTELKLNRVTGLFQPKIEHS